jgi:hypothetical protein
VAHPLARLGTALIERDQRVSLVERTGAALVPHPPLLKAMR